jgi:hypothetical protein
MSEALENAKDLFLKDAEYVIVPTERQIQLERFLLAINESLRGSQSSEVKNAAVKALRGIAKEIAKDQKEREHE